MGENNLLINGQWRSGNGIGFESLNPFTNDVVWTGKSAGETDVDQAVQSARDAFRAWASETLDARQRIVEQFAELLKTHQEDLAETIGIETGKPLWEARTEVSAMIGKIAISLRAYQERTGQSSQSLAAGTASLRHRPHGVLAVFGPYNFPGHLPNGHIVPALIAGNTVVFKPSELCPLVAEKTMALWLKAGLPDGVINLVQGEKPTGELLVKHDGIDGLLFTGSSQTGASLHKAWGGQPEKIMALEMGGNNPLIIDRDAPIEATIHHILFSSFVSAGQRCTCARRVFVPTGEYGDQLMAGLMSSARELTVGAYDAPVQPFMGCLVSAQAAENIISGYQGLLKLGAKPILELAQDNIVPAMLRPSIVDVTDVDAPDIEYFGPLLQVIRYERFEDAMQRANQTRYGLAAGLISQDEALWQRFLLESRAGIVNWNMPLTGASSAAPFGGIGASGNHRPSAFYAADYCAYPVASMEAEQATLPGSLSPGMTIKY